MLLAIDPGANTGWAVFDSARRLKACGLGDPPAGLVTDVGVIDQVVIEHPVIYPGGRTRDPNSIVKLAINAGIHAGRFKGRAAIRWVKPRDWKGTVDAEICIRRVLVRLAPEETLILERAGVCASKRHNVIDAIGLGLFSVDRCGRGVT